MDWLAWLRSRLLDDDVLRMSHFAQGSGMKVIEIAQLGRDIDRRLAAEARAPIADGEVMAVEFDGPSFPLSFRNLGSYDKRKPKPQPYVYVGRVFAPK